MRLSVCKSVNLPSCLSVCLSVCVPFFCLFARAILSLFVCPYVCLSLTRSLPLILQLHSTHQYLYYTISDGSVKRCSMEGKDCKVIYTPLDHGGYKVHAVTSDPRTKTLYLSTARYFLKPCIFQLLGTF